MFVSGLLAVVTLDADATQTLRQRVGGLGRMPGPESDKSLTTSAPRFEPDQRWVPADTRFFGVDRRTIAPTLAVFALAVVMSVVLPVINATALYHDTVKAGDVIELEGDVTFVPEAGWASHPVFALVTRHYPASIPRPRPSRKGP